MEFPTKARYRIKTKKLSYRLHEKNGVCWGKEANSSSYILKNVNCEAKPGEIMAIAGPSGAGKTTLLEILAGMIPPSRVSGHVFVNEQKMEATYFRRVSGYVTQDDALLPFLTVRETLMYTARLRLHGGFKMAVARVRDLLKELGLEHVADVRIGGESRRGISGGEMRRVSIGGALVHDPAVVLLDEPTSGLDSTSALHVTLLLKSMALTHGKTIVLTIHQPGFRILESFDQILLLSNGTVLHHGPLHLLEQLLTFAGHSVPLHVNVLEFAIEVAETLVIDIVEGDIERENEHIRGISNQVYVEEHKICYSNSQFREALILGQRFSNNIFRTKQLFVARMIQSVVAGFVLGTIFANVSNDPRGFKLKSQIGFFAFSLTFLLSSTTEGLPIYLQERRILLRETLRGSYRISSYVIANTLVFLPFLLAVALLYTTPVYWLVGLRREMEGFLYFSLVVWMVLLMSNSFVLCCSTLVPNFIMGTSLIAGLMGSFFLFSGYFISKEDIPWYWIFMHYLSLYKYPFECFMINEYGGEKGKKKCVGAAEGQCYLYGDNFLMQQGLKESHKWSNLGVMLGFILGYRILCFLLLWYRSYRTTRT
ncbi:ABC transporter G family member 10-like [Corylus avellana]|uniref:ABC transporter G family member 10-like n=1 Tax=Corylus avellana TaxID=13451 RepID=UPI00286B3A8F|nr:ABC transporter G family member 10-like [Corylus avellana]